MQRVCAWGRNAKVFLSVYRIGQVPGREVRVTFWAHFHDHFARCPDLSMKEFRSSLADFPRLRDAEDFGPGISKPFATCH